MRRRARDRRRDGARHGFARGRVGAALGRAELHADDCARPRRLYRRHLTPSTNGERSRSRTTRQRGIHLIQASYRYVEEFAALTRDADAHRISSSHDDFLYQRRRDRTNLSTSVRCRAGLLGASHGLRVASNPRETTVGPQRHRSKVCCGVILLP